MQIIQVRYLFSLIMIIQFLPRVHSVRTTLNHLPFVNISFVAHPFFCGINIRKGLMKLYVFQVR